MTDEQAEEILEDFDIHVEALRQHLADRLEKPILQYGLTVEVIE